MRQNKILFPRIVDYRILFDDNTFPDLLCETLETGRTYQNPSGNKYPSITTVLGQSKTDEDMAGIQRWRDSVGHEEADRIFKEAGKRGTALHDLCENFIKDYNNFKEPKKLTRDYYLFKQVYPYLEHVNDVLGIEAAMYSNTLKVAGKTDLIASYKSTRSIIDFKTSRKRKDYWMIQDYFIQMCAYGLMYADMFKVPITQGVILMAMDDNKQSPGDEFIVDLRDYIKPLLERVRVFYAKY